MEPFPREMLEKSLQNAARHKWTTLTPCRQHCWLDDHLLHINIYTVYTYMYICIYTVCNQHHHGQSLDCASGLVPAAPSLCRAIDSKTLWCTLVMAVGRCGSGTIDDTGKDTSIKLIKLSIKFIPSCTRMIKPCRASARLDQQYLSSSPMSQSNEAFGKACQMDSIRHRNLDSEIWRKFIVNLKCCIIILGFHIQRTGQMGDQICVTHIRYMILLPMQDARWRGSK